jgi:hypothetical protein
MQSSKNERMKKAIDDYEKGKSLRASSRDNRISYTTLQRHVTEPDLLDKGGQTYLTIEMEEELISYAKYRSSRGFGITKTQFIKEATDLVNSTITPSPRITLLSHKWWEGFKQRHPDFKALRPKGQKLKEKVNAEQNEEVIRSYFKLFRKLMLDFKFTPSQVWNVDETGSSQKETASYIVGDRRQRSVSGEESLNALHMTMVACINAEGKYSPPLFILKDDEVERSALDSAFPKSMIAISSTAYINVGIFNDWLINWISTMREQSSSPLLLIVDNCTSHICFSTVEIAKKHKVELFALPPNLTHILQPLDVCMFRSFKGMIRSTLSETLLFHRTRTLSPKQFIELCCVTLQKTFTPDSVRFAFTAAGLFPIDENKAFARIKRLNPDLNTNVSVSLNKQRQDIISKLKKEIKDLKIKAAKAQCDHKITLAEKRIPKRHPKKVKCPFAKILTQSELYSCVPVTRKSKKRPIIEIQ